MHCLQRATLPVLGRAAIRATAGAPAKGKNPRKTIPMKKPKVHVHATERSMEFCSCGAYRLDQGEWDADKDPSAVAMGLKSSVMATPEARQKRASAGGEQRWAGTSEKQRRQYMSRIASQPRPGRRNEDRCECGRFTRTYAESRGHLCGKALKEKLALQEKLG